MVCLLVPLCIYIQFVHCSGDGRHNRDQSAEEGSSKGPPRKKLRSMTMNDASNGNYEVMGG